MIELIALCFVIRGAFSGPMISSHEMIFDPMSFSCLIHEISQWSDDGPIKPATLVPISKMEPRPTVHPAGTLSAIIGPRLVLVKPANLSAQPLGSIRVNGQINGANLSQQDQEALEQILSQFSLLAKPLTKLRPDKTIEQIIREMIGQKTPLNNFFVLLALEQAIDQIEQKSK